MKPECKTCTGKSCYLCNLAGYQPAQPDFDCFDCVSWKNNPEPDEIGCIIQNCRSTTGTEFKQRTCGNCFNHSVAVRKNHNPRCDLSPNDYTPNDWKAGLFPNCQWKPIPELVCDICRNAKFIRPIPTRQNHPCPFSVCERCYEHPCDRNTRHPGVCISAGGLSCSGFVHYPPISCPKCSKPAKPKYTRPLADIKKQGIRPPVGTDCNKCVHVNGCNNSRSPYTCQGFEGEGGRRGVRSRERCTSCIKYEQCLGRVWRFGKHKTMS